MAEALGDISAATTTEALRDHGWPEGVPAWARAHLIHLATAGTCRPDTSALADLYRRVESFRNASGLPDDSGPEDLGAVLGPPLHDQRLATVRSGLAHELGAIATAPPVASLPQP